MQDIDFSWRRQPEQSLPATAAHRDPVLPKDTPRKSKGIHFALSSFFALGLCCFSLGVGLGFFIGKARAIEAEIVKRPDELRPEYAPKKPKKAKKVSRALGSPKKSFTNLGKSQDMREGSYIIKVGSYPQKRARELTKSLNGLPAFQKKKAYACKDIKRNMYLEQLAFRIEMRDEPDKENVLLGCFLQEQEARAILKALHKALYPASSHAKLFHIKD